MNRITSQPLRDLGRRVRIQGRRILAAAALGLASAGFGQCNYEITAIITPDDAEACWPLPASNTFARGMNSKGEIVGYYVPCAIGNEQAFYWSQETGFLTLPKPANAVRAFAEDINDHGIIIGRHTFSGVGGKAWVYDPNTQEFNYLEPLHPGTVATDLTTAASINNSNIVTGSRVISEPGVSPEIRNAVIWMPFGADKGGDEIIVDLGVGAGPSSGAIDGNCDISAAGWTGTGMNTTNAEATLWSETGAIGLGFLPGAVQSAAWGLNSHNEAVGRSSAGHGIPPDGFLWVKEQMTMLVPPKAFSQYWPLAISDWRQITGVLRISANEQFGGIWQHGNVVDVNEIVVNLPDDFVITSAATINSSAWICAIGEHSSKIVSMVLVPNTVSQADLNFDCAVDIVDLLHLLSEWGKPKSNADLTGNGTVGVPDLLILLANWGS